MPRDYQNQSPTSFQRLPEYQRDDEWIRACLREAKVGHIATSQNGQPFINPSTFWFDERNYQIIFHSNLVGRIRSNIESNPRVCFETSELGKTLPSNVALEFSLQFRSVIVYGKASLVNDPEEARRVPRLSGRTAPLDAQRPAPAPRFQVDPAWPKDLPNNWIIGAVTGVFVDAKDHVWVTHLPETLTEEELGEEQKPPIATCCMRIGTGPMSAASCGMTSRLRPSASTRARCASSVRTKRKSNACCARTKPSRCSSTTLALAR